MGDEACISVVIPCRGELQHLRRCLDAVQSQVSNVEHEVWVASSGNSGKIEELIKTYDMIRHVHSREPLYPGGARNLGAARAKGNWLLFLDVDCEPQVGWLEAAAAATLTGADVIGGPVLQKRPFRPIPVVDNWLQFVDFPPGRQSGWTNNFPACNCLISRQLFEDMGGFPREWRVGEDGIFKMRLAQRPTCRIYFLRGLRVSHAGRATFSEFLTHQQQMGYFRGLLGTRLANSRYRQFGRWLIAIVPVVLKRLSYMLLRNLQWNRRALVGMFLLSPLILLGLVAWAVGFRSGCKAASL